MENGRVDSAATGSGDTELKTKPWSDISAEERHRMIAEAAYFKAEQRGFRWGDSVDDWLAAEAEIDELLGIPSKKDRQDLAAYQRMRQELVRILAGVGDTVNVETIRLAFDRAAKEVRDAGGYAADTVGRVKQRLGRETESTAARLGPRWESFSEKTADLFSVWLERSSTFISNASGAVGDWLKQLQSKNETEVHIAGEIVEPGTFECKACKHRVEVEEKGALTPCPVCQAEEFRGL